MTDITARAIREVRLATIIIETMKIVVPVEFLYQLAVKLEGMAKGGGADSPFREQERDAVLLAAGVERPGIRPFATHGLPPSAA